MRREIIKIDEEKCDGCGQCVPACAEGAIQVIDGKAKLVSEVYCDGLGACIGDCPTGALTIETREADAFDEAAVEKHLESDDAAKADPRLQPDAKAPGCSFSCPGSAAQVLQRQGAAPSTESREETGAIQAQLGQWPVQLHLVPVNAPYFQDADLLITADCVPFAFADFHRKFLKGRALAVGCPKLDDFEAYRAKLTEIFRQNDIRMVEVAHMEVPCCFGMVQLVQTALRDSGKTIPLVLTRVGIRGEILERSQPAATTG
ncbi:ATP-binding protein [Candidatus Zixiibacteriota bacterium]